MRTLEAYRVLQFLSVPFLIEAQSESGHPDELEDDPGVNQSRLVHWNNLAPENTVHVRVQ
jgi:hypothetical protein